MALVPGVRPILEVAGRVFTDLTNLKFLYGYVSGAQNKHTLREAATSGAYVVPAAKTFREYAIQAEIVSVGATDMLAPNYSDTAFTSPTSGAYTNPVYIGGSSENGRMLICTPAGQKQRSYLFDVPTGKYPGISNWNGSTADVGAIVFGYEV